MSRGATNDSYDLIADTFVLGEEYVSRQRGAALSFPRFQEEPLQVDDRGAVQLHVGVAPELTPLGMLVVIRLEDVAGVDAADVDPANDGRCSIDDKNLPMVAVVERVGFPSLEG